MKTEQYAEKIEEYAKPVVSRMQDRWHDVQNRVGETARNFGNTADDYVHGHPWQTIAIVGMVACLLGFLFGSRRD